MSAPLPLKDFPGEDGGLCAGPAVLSAIMAVYFQMRQLDSQCCEDGGLLQYAVEAILRLQSRVFLVESSMCASNSCG